MQSYLPGRWIADGRLAGWPVRRRPRTFCGLKGAPFTSQPEKIHLNAVGIAVIESADDTVCGIRHDITRRGVAGPAQESTRAKGADLFVVHVKFRACAGWANGHANPIISRETIVESQPGIAVLSGYPPLTPILLMLPKSAAVL